MQDSALPDSKPAETPPREIESLIELAQLLERIEANPRFVNAVQYQSTVSRLSDALKNAVPGDVMDSVLKAFPATAQLYENLNYEHAGLARSSIEASVEAELAVRALFKRVARRTSESDQPA